MCVVYESTCLKQGTTRPTPRKPGDAGPLEHGVGDSEAETEQLTLREELRTLADRVEKRQQTGRAGMAGSQKTHLDPT